LRIVLEPSCAESDIEVRWDIPGNLPLVEADRHSLLQVLLNLSKNSQRALEAAHNKVIHISACAVPGGVAVRFTDSGAGISPGQRLFEPLQKGADGSGLGLYLSRAFMRSFRGDLRHDPQGNPQGDQQQPGCSFVLDLAAAADNPAEQTLAADENATHTTLTA